MDEQVIDKLMELLSEFNIQSLCSRELCENCLLSTEKVETYDGINLDFCDMLTMMRNYFKK